MLEQIYVVTLGTERYIRNEVSFSGIEAVISPQPLDNIPQGPIFRDPLWAQPGEVLYNAFDLAVHTFADESQFGVFNRDALTAVRMTLYGGGLAGLWEHFMPKILSYDSEIVVILLDANPLTAFRHSMEFELLHMAMRSLQADGKMVFVVSATSGGGTAVTIRDGVRYINLARRESGSRFSILSNNNAVRWSD